MKKNLIIIGASGHGKVVSDIALKLNRWKSIFFLDNNIDLKTSNNLPVVGNSEDVYKYIEDSEMFVAIGDNKIRQQIQNSLMDKGATIATLIHPSAILGSDVHIGVGTVVMPGVIINCSSKIGQGCIINTASTVDHDNIIGDYAHISPGVHLSGTVSLGSGTWIGVGGIVSNNISICDNCIIGAGGVVVKDINIRGTYAGIPVRRI